MQSLKKTPETAPQEQGNALFIVFVAIIVLALLTQMIASSSNQQASNLDRQTQDDEISRMLTQAATLGGAIHQMIVNGEDAATLYTDLSTLKPGDGGFETPPNNLKIYHPLGGGIMYMTASSTRATPVATNFSLNKGSIITGVGATDAAIGDIVFVATISAASYCQRINELTTGSTTVPVMDSAAFDDLFTDDVTVTIDGVNCASCVNVPRLCVSNTGATSWGYYATLLPG